MGHSHSHADGEESGHSHAPKNFNRAFAVGVGINVAFVAVEAIVALLSNSLSLLADAGHNLGDVFGLLLAWGASVLAQRHPTLRYTYGLRRSSVLAALANCVILLLAVGGIAWESILRIVHPETVASASVIVVASVGILVNGFTAYMFMSGKEQDVNIRGAYLHMAADAGVSFGVVIAAIAMSLTGWLFLDPAVSLAISLVIGFGTWGLLRESLRLALDAVPENIQPAEVAAYLEALPGVSAVHDLHIWAISTTEVALTAHLVKPDAVVDDALLAEISNELHERFGICHATLQFELGDLSTPCKQSLPGAV